VHRLSSYRREAPRANAIRRVRLCECAGARVREYGVPECGDRGSPDAHSRTRTLVVPH